MRVAVTARPLSLQMPGSSVMQCRVSGKFAFSEFRSIEETNLAMNLKGALFQGSVLDVKRPAKYNGPMTDVRA